MAGLDTGFYFGHTSHFIITSTANTSVGGRNKQHTRLAEQETEGLQPTHTCTCIAHLALNSNKGAVLNYLLGSTFTKKELAQL